jgi:hypothetical protein
MCALNLPPLSKLIDSIEAGTPRNRFERYRYDRFRSMSLGQAALHASKPSDEASCLPLPGLIDQIIAHLMATSSVYDRTPVGACRPITASTSSPVDNDVGLVVKLIEQPAHPPPPAHSGSYHHMVHTKALNKLRPVGPSPPGGHDLSTATPPSQVTGCSDG